MIDNPDTLAVYIHWPYCARICPYCDFNVYKGRQNAALVQAICDDLRHWRNWSGPRRVTSIHFGGGTPSLLPATDLQTLIEQVRTLWGLDADVEIALEANPNDADEAQWQSLRCAGITRLSLGVQSFHDPALALLGRDHTGTDGHRALLTALAIFPSVSVDLIFGWKGQSEQDWNRDLDIVLESGVPHISAYQLTIEPGTAFARSEARGIQRAVGEDQSADFYDLVQTKLTDAGYAHYEVSNYSQEGHRSRHNLSYWTGGDYVGVGPGAHGRLTCAGKRFETVASLTPQAYQQSIKENGHGIDHQAVLTALDWAQEYVLMGLRIQDGISKTRFSDIAGQVLPRAPIEDLSRAGFITEIDDRLIATPNGRLVLNRVTAALLGDLE